MCRASLPHRGTAVAVACLAGACLAAAASGELELAATGARTASAPKLPGVRLAITFDDLPWSGPLPAGDSSAYQPLARLAAVLRVHGAPATGFVVCERATGESSALDNWVAWGNTLGNHSWSHHDLNHTPPDRWIADVRRCDSYLKRFGEASLPYLRFPFLHEGPTLEVRERVHEALASMGLGVAHVSVDNSDWLLEQADAKAAAAHDAVTRNAIGQSFLRHVLAAVEHADRVARRKTGRSVPQVLLLHANTLVGRNLDALLLALSAEGVEYVSLERALADPVYARPDEYVGSKGLSWLYRMRPLSVEDVGWDDAQADAIRSRFLSPQKGGEAESGSRAYLALRTPAGFGPIFAEAATSERMRSLLVLHRGELVAEAYFHGAGPETPANLKSVTKSVTSALVGVALRDGRIRSLDDPLGAYLPEVAAAHPDKAVITLRELLTMSSGLRSVGYDAIQESDDWVATILAQPFGHRPGATFDYDTGVLQLLSAVLRRATGLSLTELAQRELFGPLRAELVGWRVDPTGLELGGNDAHVRPRDLARFGELYRNGGRVDGRTLLPADYVRASTAPQIVPDSGTVNHDTLPIRGYGYLWWALALDDGTAFAALGHGGQFVLVFPRRELVVVMTSRWPGVSSVDHYRLVTHLLVDRLLPRFPMLGDDAAPRTSRGIEPR